MNRADLNRVPHIKLARLAGIDALAIDEGPIRAVEILDGKRAGCVVVNDQSMLARGPDAVVRFLVSQIDIDRLIVGSTDEVFAGIDIVFLADLQTALNDQFNLGTNRDWRLARGRFGGRGWRRAYMGIYRA